MLEIKGLTKVYRSKTGEEVRALDGVDISFPETGMVFILGKSGSGKSTLLNIMGGLDSYDSGEFIIKGKSSKDFAGSDFDAYRNTFIGFIFQEYNVLDDFTVGANIALALELQGKKATPEAIGSILTKVDLTDYAKRKPNELSGGQKQRVAIARALVKDPQIIMADEPTGALDSTTGKQIFDTLKNLSKTKLVLVVSHDRDFAERYADRIVELADGRIVSDVTKHEHEGERVSSGIEKIGKSILRIKAGYTLTAEDIEMINAYLAENANDVLISGDGRVNDELRSAAGISDTGGTAVFEKTDTGRDYTLKKYEKKDSHFIRSRLPMKNAVHMGASGLKHKRFRLVMTVFLSLIAFALFGFADTLAAYDKLTATVDSLGDSNVRNASVTLSLRHTTTYGDGDTDIYYSDATLNDEDIEYLREITGLDFVPVFTGSRYGGYYNGGFSVRNSFIEYNGESAIYTSKLHGLVNMTDEMLSSVGLEANPGRLPEAQGEIAITELMYRQFNHYGFIDAVTGEQIKAGELTDATDGSKNSIIGKSIEIRSEKGTSTLLKIVGIVDTHFDYDRYADFLPSDDELSEDESNFLEYMVLQMEIESEIGYGFHALGFAHKEDIDNISENTYFNYEDLGTYMYNGNKFMYFTVRLDRSSMGDDKENYTEERNITNVAGSKALNKLKITWLDGERGELGDGEIILPVHLLDLMMANGFTLEFDYSELDAYLTDKYGTAWTMDRGEYENVYDDIFSAAQIYYSNLQYEDMVVKMQTDVYPFFLEKLGITMPSADMTIYGSNYYELENMIRNMQVGDGGKIAVSVEWYQVERTIRLLETDYVAATHDLVNDAVFMSKMVEHYYGGTLGERTEEELARDVRYFYADYYLVWSDSDFGYENNSYGLSGKEINDMAREIVAQKSGTTPDSLAEKMEFYLSTHEWRDGIEVETSSDKKSYTVVGFYESTGLYSDMVISDTVLAEFEQWRIDNMDEYSYIEDIAEHDDGIWAYALAPLTKDRGVIEKIVSLSYAEDGVDIRFEMQNYIMDTLDSFNDFIEVGSQVFLYVGLGFAVFSGLLLMNFIATSISYKKREIGVLRAVGARSSDVFKIFFSEALMIALINFICSTVVVIAGVIVANKVMHNNGISITLLSYGARQFVLMLAVSVVVAIVSSFLPVNAIARKKPVDAIKDK